MSTTAKYDAILQALWATPPGRRLVAVLRAEDNEEPVTEAGRTRRAVAAAYVKIELGRIITAIRDTEKAVRGEP